MRAIRSQVRGKNAEERSAKRASLAHNLQAPPRFNGQTALEVMAVSPRTSKDYQRRVLVFQGYCRIHQLETTTSCQIDHALTLFLNQGFSEGMDISEAAKFFASVMEANPVVGRMGLVRSKRALKGWKNLDPGNSRSPLAWPFISLMATTLMQLGLPHAALCILTMFSTYIRPSEALKIRCQDLVRSVQLGVSWAINLNPLESMEQSKVGLSHEAILLDSQGMEFLGPALERLRTGAAPTDLLFRMDDPTLHASWKKALLSLNLPQDFAVLYQIRHSGASWDALRKYRSLLEIKLRAAVWRDTRIMLKLPSTSNVSPHRSGGGQRHLQGCWREWSPHLRAHEAKFKEAYIGMLCGVCCLLKSVGTTRFHSACYWYSMGARWQLTLSSGFSKPSSFHQRKTVGFHSLWFAMRILVESSQIWWWGSSSPEGWWQVSIWLSKSVFFWSFEVGKRQHFATQDCHFGTSLCESKYPFHHRKPSQQSGLAHQRNHTAGSFGSYSSSRPLLSIQQTLEKSHYLFWMEYPQVWLQDMQRVTWYL